MLTSMEKCPWRADSRSSDQKVTSLLRILKVHYCVHKDLPLDPILSHMNWVHILTPHSFRDPLHYYPPICTKVLQVPCPIYVFWWKFGFISNYGFSMFNQTHPLWFAEDLMWNFLCSFLWSFPSSIYYLAHPSKIPPICVFIHMRDKVSCSK